MMLNCIAVDDEPLALGLVCAFIEQTPFLNLVGKFSSAIEALKVIHQQKIDVMYLDIQMPDLNGIELARVLDHSPNKPRIIFTTAYNQFALEGYRVDALDYLLKPFNYEEFLRSAHKAMAYYELVNKPGTTITEKESIENDYLFLKVEYQLMRIAFKDIVYIESLKDYVKVWLNNGEKPVMSLTSLKALEEKLPASRFMRVHRSYIVALDKINAINRNAININNINITVGDQYKETFNQFVKKWG
ncbi:response regulator transcription factor [Mucilaginibacter corticis]|uniref:Response regulator transcription factor n=1 Tax=Mucilaginibacter corticis TaxID=2597670 RepID=A0A556MX41_9SPHI|nr:LytTR family DNA-binding domain-containing protein [Mucilaginibacter corticis]TSJ44378.1 response regulator transcription factor [Mucilaginibacter corticis]